MQQQEVIKYHRANAVAIYLTDVPLKGFRVFGVWSDPGGPELRFSCHPFPFLANMYLVDNYIYRRQLERGVKPMTHLAVERAPSNHTWYAAFAVPDKDPSMATVSIVPFLRVGVVSGNTVTLADETGGTDAKGFNWRSGTILKSANCLVVTESHEFSGRVTTITAHTECTVTLRDAGQITTLDSLLPAPPGAQQFGYIGSFFYAEKGVSPFPEHGVTWHTCFGIHRCPIALSMVV